MRRGRTPIPDEVKEGRKARYLEARTTLEPMRSQRGMSIALDLGSYRGCEKYGSDPGFEALRAAYARLESVQRLGHDAAASLATWIQTGRGLPPWKKPATAAPEAPAPAAPPTAEGNPIIRMIEAELDGEVTDANARLVVETLRQILATARKAGLIALHVAFLVIAMDKAEAREVVEAREAQGGNVGKLSIRDAKPENILFSWFVLGRGAGSHILVVVLGLQERKPVRLKVAV